MDGKAACGAYFSANKDFFCLYYLPPFTATRYISLSCCEGVKKDPPDYSPSYSCGNDDVNAFTSLRILVKLLLYTP